MGLTLFNRKSVGALQRIYLCCLESNLQSTLFFFCTNLTVSFLLQLQFPPFSSSPTEPGLFRGCQRFEALTQSVVLWTLEWGWNRVPQHILTPLSFKRPSPLVHHHVLVLLFEHSTQQCFNRFGCLFSNCFEYICVWRPAVVFSYLCNVPLNGSTCGIHKQLDIILLLIRQLIIFSFRSFKKTKTKIQGWLSIWKNKTIWQKQRQINRHVLIYVSFRFWKLCLYVPQTFQSYSYTCALHVFEAIWKALG